MGVSCVCGVQDWFTICSWSAESLPVVGRPST